MGNNLFPVRTFTIYGWWFIIYYHPKEERV